jgi:hypothetical protein
MHREKTLAMQDQPQSRREGVPWRTALFTYNEPRRFERTPPQIIEVGEMFTTGRKQGSSVWRTSESRL